VQHVRIGVGQDVLPIRGIMKSSMKMAKELLATVTETMGRIQGEVMIFVLIGNNNIGGNDIYTVKFFVKNFIKSYVKYATRGA